MAKKWLPIAAIAVIGLGCFSLLKKGQAATFLSGNVTGIKIEKISLLSTTLTVKVMVANPSGVDINFDSLTAKVFFQGSAIATITVYGKDTAVIFKKFAETPIQFPVTVSNAGIITQLIKSINSGKLDITVEGLVQSGSLQIPFNTNYVVPLKKAATDSTVAGIGKPYVKLEFADNDSVQAYFKQAPKNDSGLKWFAPSKN